MKKIRILIAMLCLCLLIVGCESTENTDRSSLPTGQDSSTALSDNVAGGSSSSSHNSGVESSLPSDGGLIVTPRPDGYYGIEEYNEFMETFDAPSGFVKYEEIAEFGDFNSMYFTSITDPEKGDYSEYRYNLKNKYGTAVSLSIYQHEEDFHPSDVGELSVEDVNTTDMRRLKNKTKGILEYDGIWYTYLRRGQLDSITWTVSGKAYSLSVNELKYVSAFEDGSIEQKLLNIETAKDALIEMFGENFAK